MVSPDASATAQRVQTWLADHMETFSRRLASIVAIDSGPGDRQGRDAVARRLAAWAGASGLSVETLPTSEGEHLVVRLEGGGTGRVVLLGHHDTVFPAGTAARFGYDERDGRAFGPGVADMKGGLVLGLMAMEALAAMGALAGTVELHSAPDEETRTKAFAAIDLVASSDAVLVLECGRENGDVVAGRKTAAWVELVARGSAAHAGTRPDRGRSAVLALSEEVIRCHALNGARPGLTVVTGTFHGGTLPNVVPDYAEAVLDVRALSAEDLDWALGAITETKPHDGVAVRARVQGRWPGIEAGVKNARLLDHTRQLAAALGQSLGAQTSGGMSDGCWTAERGVPTLDGLGPVGGGDHSSDEYIELKSVPFRCGLVAGLCVAAVQDKGG